MSGTVKVNQVQLGDSGTATNNFVLSVPASPDGTVKLSRGNVGATTQDVLTVDADGKVGLPQQTVSSSTTNTVTNKVALVIGGVTYYLLASTSGT